MKKLYIEPELELISIRLTEDVLGGSQFEPTEEKPFETTGEDNFEDPF